MAKATTKPRKRGRPNAYEVPMELWLHLKIPDWMMKALDEEAGHVVPFKPSRNAVAREALKLGIEAMRGARGMGK